MKFLCDQMLSRLGKWLRAAGYDTEIITNPIPDREVLSIAIAENRLLITRDRHFLEIKAAHSILLYLKSNDLKACIQELNQKININWLHDSFSRCLTCNHLLETQAPNECLEQLPLQIRQKKNEFWYCPTCHHLYWEGSHTQRMRHQLQVWQHESRLYHEN